jgi:hypothetical protein
MAQMSKGAQKISQILRRAKYKFQTEYEFDDLRGKKGVHLRYDFMVWPPYSRPFLIEFDGEAHFQQVKFFQKNTSTFKAAQERDRIKNKYALMKGILLYRIPYWEIDNINSIEDIIYNHKFIVKTKYHNDMLKAP